MAMYKYEMSHMGLQLCLWPVSWGYSPRPLDVAFYVAVIKSTFVFQFWKHICLIIRFNTCKPTHVLCLE